ncbi:MAG: tetratricopeptide repeat protein [Opitutaceae bacterium]
MSWRAYAFTQCDAIVTNLGLLFWPHPLIIDHGTAVVVDPSRVAPQALVVLLLLVTMVVTLVHRPVAGFLLFSTFAILAPTSSILPLVGQTMAEHRMYLPLAPLLALVIGGTYRICGSWTVRLLILTATALGITTMTRTVTMQDEIELWTDTVAKVPTNARAHGNLGLALFKQGRDQDSLRAFQRALELDSESVALEHNIGNVYFRLREFDDAARHHARSVALDPKHASGYTSLGDACMMSGNPAGAAAHYRRAIELNPKSATNHHNLAAALAQTGEPAAAVALYETAIRLDPELAAAHANLGHLLLSLNRPAEAVTPLRRARALNSSDRRLHYDLALSLLQPAQFPEAISELEALLSQDPQNLDARNAYGVALMNAHRADEAIRQFELILSEKPADEIVRSNRDRLRALETPKPQNRPEPPP